MNEKKESFFAKLFARPKKEDEALCAAEALPDTAKVSEEKEEEKSQPVFEVAEEADDAICVETEEQPIVEAAERDEGEIVGRTENEEEAPVTEAETRDEHEDEQAEPDGTAEELKDVEELKEEALPKASTFETTEAKPVFGKTVRETAESEEAVKKEEKKGGLSVAAKAFGVSEERLENEFKKYKLDKLAQKVSLLLCDPYLGSAAIAEKIKTAISLKIASVTVLPNRLKLALDAAQGRIPVNVAVCFPYGADTSATRQYAVKKVAATGVSGIEIPFDPTAERGLKNRMMLNDYKKLVKAAKRKPLTVVIEASSYTDGEIKAIVETLVSAGVKGIKASSGIRRVLSAAYAEKNVVEAADGRMTVTACSSEYTPEGVIDAFSYGVNYAASFNATEAVLGLRELLVVNDD